MALSFGERTKYLHLGLLICAKCEESKKLEEFFRTGKNSSGYVARCRECISQDRKDQRKADPTLRLRHHLSSAYGVTIERFQQMEEEQDGLCRICERPPQVGGQERLSVKVHPQTREFIALLCNNCAHGLGKFGDNPEIMRRAADFMEQIDISPKEG